MTQLMRTLGYGLMLAAVFTLILSSGGSVHAQQAPAPEQLLSPDQLDDMVAPIALYPDPLISQILVASTYPLEIVEANQWLQRNPNMQGSALSQSALAQDWDPSIQALVVFPDVLKFLMEDIAWTTAVGNAFLAQEADVMDAIQRMRDRAARSGKLQTTPEQQVIRYVDAGQPVYEIVPVNPTVIYVPVYDPFYIWGTAYYYPYPRWYYPPRAAHLYFNSGIYIDAYFGSGWYGSSWSGPTYTVWNNWGWRPAWNSRTVVVNNVFIDNHHFNSGRPRNVSVAATSSWSHDSAHRRGVVYPTSAPYDRYRDSRNVSRPQQAQTSGRDVPAQVSAWNSGTNTARQSSPSADRTTSRIAGRDTTPNTQNRDNRGTPDVRNDRGNPNAGSNRGATNSAQPAQTAAAAPTPVTSSRPAQELAWSRGSTSRVPTVSNAQAPAPVNGARGQIPAQEQNRSRNGASQTQVATSNPGSVNTTNITRQAGPAQEQNRTRTGVAQPTTATPATSTPTNLTRQVGQVPDQSRARNGSPVQTAASNPTPMNVSRQTAPVHEPPQSHRTFQDDPTYIRQTQLSQNPAASVVRSSPSTTGRESQNSARETRSVPQQPRQTASTPQYQSASRQPAPGRSASSDSRQVPAQSASTNSNASGRGSNGGSDRSTGSSGSSNTGGNSRGRR